MTKNEFLLDNLDKSQSLDELYAKVCGEIPETTAMIYNGTEITYSQLGDKVAALATAFVKLGIAADDRIAIIMPTRPEFVYVWLAASKIGASIVGLNFRYTAEEVTYMVNNTKPTVMVCINEFNDTKYSDFLSGIKADTPSLDKFIFLGTTDFPGALDLEKLLATEPDHAILSQNAAKNLGERDNFIIHTSGTTGKPKGAVILQKNILAMMRPWVRAMGVEMGDTVFCMLPLNHVGGGTIVALSTLAKGGTLVFMDIFDPNLMVELLQKYKVTILGGVPTIFEIVFALRPDLSADMFPDIKLMLYGGSPATSETITAMFERFGAEVMACYGATEVSGFCSYSRRGDAPELWRSAGKPGQGVEMKIVHPSERHDLPQGEIGEIAVRSEMVFNRYLNLPEETAKAFSDDGWFYTGDLAVMDENGYFTIAGRSKEMFINSGFNVYPKEIEDKLSQHPGVSVAAVLGMPHPTKGEVGWAFIMPTPGVNVCEDDLLEHCKKTMADYKVPERVFFEESLPISPVGKIIKPELRKLSEQKI